jgi:archaellum biogenesis ATPase FlaH
MSKYILINGKKRSGKDYLAKLLKNEFEKNNYTCKIIAFADPIKEIIAKTFGMSNALLDKFKNNKEKLYVSVKPYEYQEITNFRSILQNFGTEAMQSTFGKTVWVDFLLKNTFYSDKDFIIVPDFRFLSENIGFKTINIFNKNLEDDGDHHKSENELNDFIFDYTVDNTDHPDLEKKVKTLVKFILNENNN